MPPKNKKSDETMPPKTKRAGQTVVPMKAKIVILEHIRNNFNILLGDLGPGRPVNKVMKAWQDATDIANSW